MGLEPTTSWLPAMRSSQLSYIPILVLKISDFFGMIAQKVFDGLQKHTFDTIQNEKPVSSLMKRVPFVTSSGFKPETFRAVI